MLYHGVQTIWKLKLVFGLLLLLLVCDSCSTGTNSVSAVICVATAPPITRPYKCTVLGMHTLHKANDVMFVFLLIKLIKRQKKKGRFQVFTVKNRKGLF